MFKSQVCLRKAFYTTVWRTYPGSFSGKYLNRKNKIRKKRAARDTIKRSK